MRITNYYMTPLQTAHQEGQEVWLELPDYSLEYIKWKEQQTQQDREDEQETVIVIDNY